MSGSNELFQKIKQALVSPVTIGAVLLMIVNDHLLKGSGLLPGIITGKLSDIAFLFFIPIFCSFIFRTRTFSRLVISYIVPLAVFILINTIPAVSDIAATGFSTMIPTKFWPDVTDLLTCAVVPLSFLYVITRNPHRIDPSNRVKKYGEIAICSIIMLTCIATSPREQDSFTPVYMSWEELRSSVRVEAPKPVSVSEQTYTRDPHLKTQDSADDRKIYIKDNYLYLSEPNKGIHIIDISDPSKPEPKAFISIPGNLDIAIKGSALYADSFTDLLVFCLAQYPQDTVLVTRKENVFPYDPYQTRPDVADFYYSGKIDKNKGVVIDWEQTRETGRR